MTQSELIVMAWSLCKKFVDKAESGRARSVETYADCKAWLEAYEQAEREYEEELKWAIGEVEEE